MVVMHLCITTTDQEVQWYNKLYHWKSISAFLVTNTAEYAHPMLQYTDAM